MNSEENQIQNLSINLEKQNTKVIHINDVEMSDNYNKNTNEKKESESNEEKEISDENFEIKIKETENLEAKNIIKNTALILEKKNKNKRNREKEKSIRRINNFSFVYERVYFLYK